MKRITLLLSLFLLGAINAFGLTISTGGDSPWTRFVNEWESGHMWPGRESYISTTVTGPGTITFDWKLDTEYGKDLIGFAIDSSYQKILSGNFYWRYEAFSVPAGTHTLSWVYAKDDIDSDYWDHAYVRDIIFVASTPLAKPDTPSGVAATDGSYSEKVRITWNAASRATSYEVWRHTSNNSGSASRIGSPVTTYFDDTSASPGTTYYYWVKAVNSSGASGFSGSNSGYRQKTPAVPSAPSNVSASDGTYADKVRITWSGVSGATSYEVWRNTVNTSGSSSRIATPSSTSFEDTSASSGITYYYWIKAKNSVGASGFSASNSGYRKVNPPAAPTGVTATDGTFTDKVRVTWNGVSGATSYEVWRHTSNNAGSATKIGSDSTATSYEDVSANVKITYYYWVKAKNAGGSSGFSGSNSGWREQIQTVAALIFSPDGGAHTGASVMVRISCATDGATIRYTTNGVDPTKTTGSAISSGQKIAVPIPVILKAQAWKPGMLQGTVKASRYTVRPEGIRINCGGNKVPYWESDRGYISGTTTSTVAVISKTKSESQKVYQTCRIGSNFSYSIPEVPNGEYEVRLYFAEFQSNKIGERIFRLNVEGVTIVTNLDVFALAKGKNRALRLSYNVVVSDGNGLQIQCIGKKGTNAFINGIEIIPFDFAPYFEFSFPNKLVYIGDSFDLVAHAMGKPAPSYKWYFNGYLIEAATGFVYSISSATLADSGIYSVMANNSEGSIGVSCGVLVRDPYTPSGAGSLSDPYRISTLGHLAWLSSNCTNRAASACYSMENDIDASDTTNWNNGLGFCPIGSYITSSSYFRGQFRGNGHTISKLFINRPTESQLGLFGYTSGSEISDLGLEDCIVAGSNYVGCLIGDNRGNIINCYVAGSAIGNDSVGGLVGGNYDGIAKGCYSTVTVIGKGASGGLVGDNRCMILPRPLNSLHVG